MERALTIFFVKVDKWSISAARVKKRVLLVVQTEHFYFKTSVFFIPVALYFNDVSRTKFLVDAGGQSMKPQIESHFNLKVIPQYCVHTRHDFRVVSVRT